MIISSGNHYIAALKRNQPGLFKDVVAHFIPESTDFELNKGHGRIEKRTVSICHVPEGVRPWPGVQTIIRVESERQLTKGGLTIVMRQTRYYIASFCATAQEFARRIRRYWGVENRVHYVRDVTQGEDKSRIRTTPLPQIFAVARNFILNLYRNQMFENMAQAQRLCSFGLDTLKQLFRMK